MKTFKEKVKEIETYLEKKIKCLKCKSIGKRSHYEKGICKVLPELKYDGKRYWDAKHKETSLCIEFKKGQNIWLDLVRYSEVKLETSRDAKEQTLTLFFIPSKNDKTEIEEIIGVKTTKLIKKLKLTKPMAKQLIKIHNSLPRTFNAQAKLTPKDVRGIKEFSIKRQ